MLRTIIFDLDGVFWRRDFELLGNLVCSRLEVPSAFHNYFAPLITNAIYSIPTIGDRVKKQLVLEKLAVVPMLDPSSLYEILTDSGLLYADINPQAFQIVRSLHKKGYHLTCRTNWFRSVQLAELGRAGMLPYFDNSKIIGMLGEFFKPDIRSLDTIIGKRKPEEFIIIGDTLEKEILLANSIGIKSIWLNEDGHCESPKDQTLQPTHEIYSLIELLTIL